MIKYTVGKRVAAIEWFEVTAESGDGAIAEFNAGRARRIGMGDMEEDLEDMVVPPPESDGRLPLPATYAQVRRLRAALALVSSECLNTPQRTDDPHLSHYYDSLSAATVLAVRDALGDIGLVV